MGAGTAVAKKRSKPGPKPSPEGPRTAVIAIKCWPEYRDWVRRLAQHDQRLPSVVIERALADYAAKVGFELPPER